MKPDEIRLECLRIAAQRSAKPEELVEDAERFASFVNGYRYTARREVTHQAQP